MPASSAITRPENLRLLRGESAFDERVNQTGVRERGKTTCQIFAKLKT